MEKNLQENLYKKYPKLFRQKNLSMKETCMCWGINCGDGWYDLLDKICGYLQFHSDQNAHLYPQIEFVQVKEKFGTLRLYHRSVAKTKEEYEGMSTKCTDSYEEFLDDCRECYRELYGAISFAESLSAYICEHCGQPGRTMEIRAWYYTVCPECEEKIKYGYGKKN